MPRALSGPEAAAAAGFFAGAAAGPSPGFDAPAVGSGFVGDALALAAAPADGVARGADADEEPAGVMRLIGAVA